MKRRGRRSWFPTVNEQAVRAYLGRPLDDHDWLKEVPKAELEAHARDLGHRFATDAWHNQLVCFTIGAALESFLFFLKMGGGKSKITLDLIRYRKRRGELARALILAPELVHVSSWEDQIREHAPDLSYSLLLGDRSRRELLLSRKADVCVMNYKGLEVYMTELRADKKGERRKKRIAPGPAAEFAALFNFVAYDESHRLGNRDSLLFEMCRWLSVATDYRYALTGTPFGRDPTKLWSQFFLVDHGLTLGRAMAPFRHAFFTPKEDYWAGVQWSFDEGRAKDLHRIIKHRSITYELEELRDMPNKISVRLPVRLSDEGAAYYSRIIAGIREARGDYQSLGNVYLRMRQCASGFLSLKADDESRIEVQFKDNPKLDALHDFLTSKPDEKILVFHEFTHSGRMIERMLDQAKIGFASLRGEIKDQGAQYWRFLNDRKCRVFVLNNSLGSEAINPQYVCRRAVFYESPDDPIRRAQAEGRVHRPGQRWRTFIHDLLVRGTIEEKILSFNREGKSLLRAVLSGEESLEDANVD